MEIPFSKGQTLKKSPKIALQIGLPLLLLTVIPLCYTFKRNQPNIVLKDSIQPSPSHNDEVLPEPTPPKCDIFSGEWVPNPKAPYYTNYSCWAIHEHQNCMKYGRPDSDFMKWRWKPDGCELPMLNPAQFFEIVRGKSLAFVGDSVARNQMQSLICLLSRVEYPLDVSETQDEHYKRWHYKSYNFTIAMFTTTFLVRAHENDPNGPTGTGLFGLFLDEPDSSWSAHIDDFDYVIISAGHWFFRPLMYYENRRLIGCRFCQIGNVTDFPISYGYRKAFRTAFRAILERERFNGVVYVRTFAPSHFEGGEWNKGGNCLRKRPYKSSEIKLEGVDLDLYMAQVEEFTAAEAEARRKGRGFRLMDLTTAILMRPDGHPSRYGHWPEENVTLYNDCVHWCLPGAIDTWNDFLMEMLKNEGIKGKQDKVLFANERNMKSK